jgi:hypothetical protein
MSTRRTVLIALVLSCGLGSTVALAAPMQCPGATLATYLAPAFACSQDGGVLTFKSFVYNGPLDPAQINVSPLDVPGSVGFFIVGNFAVPAGQNATYVFSYFIDPPPIIHGEQVDLDPMGSVMLVEDLCVTAFPCAGGNSLGKLTTTTGNTMASTGLGNLNALGIQNTLTLTGGATGANSQGFDNVTFIVPEPSGILLAASGLLGLLAFRSRAKLRRIRR